MDVANKPAVKGGDVISFMEEVMTTTQRRGFPSAKPDFRVQGGSNWNSRKLGEKLEKELKGLKIRYKRPDGQQRQVSIELRDFFLTEMIKPNCAGN